MQSFLGNRILTWRLNVPLVSSSEEKGRPCKETTWVWRRHEIKSWTETRQSPRNWWPIIPENVFVMIYTQNFQRKKAWEFIVSSH